MSKKLDYLLDKLHKKYLVNDLVDIFTSINKQGNRYICANLYFINKPDEFGTFDYSFKGYKKLIKFINHRVVQEEK